MAPLTVAQLIQLLQVAVGPVVLTSGIGLLLLSMTNRLGRVVDRARALVRELDGLTVQEQGRLRAQLHVLTRRAGLLRTAIIFSTISILLAVLLVLTLFVTAIFQEQAAWLIGTLFVGTLLALVVSLIAFILDLNQSLVAFKMDLGKWMDAQDG
jgi:hypothetical protein